MITFPRFFGTLGLLVAGNLIGLLSPVSGFAQDPDCSRVCVTIDVEDVLTCLVETPPIDTSPGLQPQAGDPIVAEIPYTLTNCSLDSAAVSLRFWSGDFEYPPIGFDMAPGEVRNLSVLVEYEGEGTLPLLAEATASLLDGTCSVQSTDEGSLTCIQPQVQVAIDAFVACGAEPEVPIRVTNPGDYTVNAVLDCLVDGLPLFDSISIFELGPGQTVVQTLPVSCTPDGVEFECVAVARLVVDPRCEVADTSSARVRCEAPSLALSVENADLCVGSPEDVSVLVTNESNIIIDAELICELAGTVTRIPVANLAGGESRELPVPVSLSDAGPTLLRCRVATLGDVSACSASAADSARITGFEACVSVDVGDVVSCVSPDIIDVSRERMDSFDRSPGFEAVVEVPVTVTNCSSDSARALLDITVGQGELPSMEILMGPGEVRVIPVAVVCTEPGTVPVTCRARVELLDLPSCIARAEGEGRARCLPHSVSIDKISTPAEVGRQDPFAQVTLRVRNTGDIALDPVRVEEHLPAGLTYASGDPSGDWDVQLDRIETDDDGRSRVFFTEFRLEPREVCTLTYKVRCEEFTDEALVDTAFVAGFCDGVLDIPPATDFDTATLRCFAPECGLDLSVTATPDVVIPTPPVDCESAGRPTSMSFRWTGGGCEASNNNQAEGKTECSGSVDESLPATVRVGGGNNGDTFYNLSVSEISLGETFTISAEKIESSSVIWLTNAGGTERNMIHTSCSQPFVMGNQFGSLTLVGFNEVFQEEEATFTYEVTNRGDDLEGVTIEDDLFGLIAGSFSLARDESRTFTRELRVEQTVTARAQARGTLAGTDLVCTDEDSATVTVNEPEEPCRECEGGVTALTLKYLGDAAATILIESGDVTFGPEVVPAGGEILIRSDDPGNKLTDMDIFVNGDLNTEIHTSCSQPVHPGVVYGDFEILGGRSKKGGPFCPPVIDCNYAVNEIKFEDDKVKFKIENLGEGYLTLDRLEISWPEEDGDIIKVKFTDELFEGRRSSSPTVFGPRGLLGSFLDRSIEPGKEETLEIRFSRKAKPRDIRNYDIRVVFTAPDCVLEINEQSLPEPDVCDSGDPAILTMEYTAGTCADSRNDQDSGKVDCRDYVTGGGPDAGYLIARKDDRIWYSGPVVQRGTFDIDARNAGKTKLDSNTTLQLFTDAPDRGGVLVQEVEFHTSCSQPLRRGDVFGGFVLREFVSENTLKSQSAGAVTGPVLTAFPNPVRNGAATIQFEVPDASQNEPVEVLVFDVAGRLVRRLDGSARAGLQSVSWDLRDSGGRGVPNGIYFYSLTVGSERVTRRLLVLPN